jgi:hypothetical protein
MVGGVRGRLPEQAREPEAPPHLPYPPRRALPPWRFVAYVGLLLVVIVGGLAVLLWPAPEAGLGELSDEELAALIDAQAPPGAPAIGPTSLIISSEPSGSVVVLGRDVVGVTPLRLNELPPGFYALSLESAAHATHDTLLYLGAGETLRVWHRHRPAQDLLAEDLLAEDLLAEDLPPGPTEDHERLALPSRQQPEAPPRQLAQAQAQARAAAPAPPPAEATPRAEPEPVVQEPPPTSAAALIVSTEPAGAQVLVNGRAMGQSPLRLDGLGPGSYHVVVQRAGYRTVSQTVEVEAGRSRTFWTALEPSHGTLLVVARPWATLYVNGDLRASESDLQHAISLPVGTHRVRAVHPQLGARERVVEVRPNEAVRVVFDFNR